MQSSSHHITMDHKKPNIAPRSKPSPPGDSASFNGAAAPYSDDSPIAKPLKFEHPDLVSKSDAIDTASYAWVKLECERALTFLRRGNHTKALRLMRDLGAKHEGSPPQSALIHRVQGTVRVKVAGITDDPTAKQRHLKNAVESAKMAVELSPDSIEFAHFYANLLYEMAKEYEEAVHECERALMIENPVDPGKESLQEENDQLKISTAEARVANVRGQLRSLVQKSNIASISMWMKNLASDGDEKFRIIPIRSEDPIVIKKVKRTPEERRKEIEARVAAAAVGEHYAKLEQTKKNEIKQMAEERLIMEKDLSDPRLTDVQREYFTRMQREILRKRFGV